MIISMFTVFNPWIFFDDSLFLLGLDMKECFVLLTSIFGLIIISYLQKKICIRDWIVNQPYIIRSIICICAILVIMVFGTYGYGFDAQAFIYGGF